MAYTALYRKLRPQLFRDVVGQDHIVRTLKNQIVSGRVSHAYLFCGTRGTGKTSTAKIFARSVNCLQPVEGEPCNECSQCESMLAGRSVNVIEIDAASNNGVDNIREIRDDVKYVPAQGTHKVFIIDEVHMLSAGAFNALLKTLEEPPEHVVFLLATTDPQKIPPTILSRCQRFDFKRITNQIMLDTLVQYGAGENIQVDREALRYICSLSDGAMRDALSLLDQCTAFYYGEEITLEKVQYLVGAVDKQVFFDLTQALRQMDGSRGLQLIHDIVTNGRDLNQFVAEAITHFRNLLVAGSAEDYPLDLSKENVARLREQAALVPPELVMKYIYRFSALQGQMRYAANPRILLETECIKLCYPQSATDGGGDREQAPGVDQGLLLRVEQLEAKLKNGLVPAESKKPVKTQAPLGPKPTPPAAKPEHIAKIQSGFGKLIEGFIKGSKDSYTKEALSCARTGYLGGDTLYLVLPQSTMADFLAKKKGDLLQEAIEKKFEVSVSLEYIDEEGYKQKEMAAKGIVAQDEKQVIREDDLADLNGIVQWEE